MFQALEQWGECEEKDFWFRQFAELEKESPALCYFAIMYGWVNRCNRCPVRKAFTNCRIDINFLLVLAAGWAALAELLL